jgi:hypothetical protein
MQFYYFIDYLDEMHQASLKYKLGKLERTPLDVLSFAYYHKYIRQYILLQNICGTEEETTYQGWNTRGWRPSLVGDDRFIYDQYSPLSTLNSFINYLFTSIIHRPPSTEELHMFLDYMLDDNGGYRWSYDFNVKIDENHTFCDQIRRRQNTAEDVFEYLSRLSELYVFQEVQ